MITDYKSLVQAWEDKAKALQPHRPLAGIARSAFVSKGSQQIVVHWTKAHRSDKHIDDLEGDDWFQAVGNQHADEWAKRAVEWCHPVWSTTATVEAYLMAEHFVSFCTCLAKCFAHHLCAVQHVSDTLQANCRRKHKQARNSKQSDAMHSNMAAHNVVWVRACGRLAMHAMLVARVVTQCVRVRARARARPCVW